MNDIEHDPSTCHICINPNLHGEQAPSEDEREIDRLRAQLNEARASTVEANMVVAGLLEELAREREAMAALANWHLNTAAIAVTEPERLRGYRDACADIETAIRARGAK